MIIRYLRNLNGGRLVLWFYFIWYLVVKGKGFFLIFSPNPWEILAAVGLCALFYLAHLGAKVIPEFRP